LNDFFSLRVHYPNNRALGVTIEQKAEFVIRAEMLRRVNRFHRLNQLTTPCHDLGRRGNRRNGDILLVILQRADFHKTSPNSLIGRGATSLQFFFWPADSIVVKLFGILLYFSVLALASPDDKATGNAATAQQDSLAQQRASIAKQLRSTTNSSFFSLPPPEPPGGEGVSFTDCDPLPEDQLKGLIDEAASRESLKPDLIRGIIRQESGARPCAVSPKGAQGLMQLMPATSEQFGVTDPFDPKQNIQAGAKLMKQLLTRYGGDVTKALAAYNAGPGRVDQAGGAVPAIAETIHYVASILAALPH
jgi:hypothetical protein